MVTCVPSAIVRHASQLLFGPVRTFSGPPAVLMVPGAVVAAAATPGIDTRRATVAPVAAIAIRRGRLRSTSMVSLMASQSIDGFSRNPPGPLQSPSIRAYAGSACLRGRGPLKSAFDVGGTPDLSTRSLGSVMDAEDIRLATEVENGHWWYRERRAIIARELRRIGKPGKAI